ncbi:MAG: hypothetical protein JST86_14450 [Bacteroidetes bacterium]|nr:hypothetical protein [Bacteroidota bacterium]
MKKALLIVATVFTFFSCHHSGNNNAGSGPDSIRPVRINTPVPSSNDKKKDAPKTIKPAIINIQDTISPKRLVIFMKDSAKTFDRISMKLGIIYAVKLGDVLKKNKVSMAGPPMAWYKTQKAPYFFEAGVAINKRPVRLPAGVYIREMKSDSALVAHFYGPYSLLSQGYDAVKERLKDTKKTLAGTPFELYIDDPVDKNGKAIDPYKVRTDIVFPYH